MEEYDYEKIRIKYEVENDPLVTGSDKDAGCLYPMIVIAIGAIFAILTLLLI